MADLPSCWHFLSRKGTLYVCSQLAEQRKQNVAALHIFSGSPKHAARVLEFSDLGRSLMGPPRNKSTYLPTYLYYPLTPPEQSVPIPRREVGKHILSSLNHRGRCGLTDIARLASTDGRLQVANAWGTNTRERPKIHRV